MESIQKIGDKLLEDKQFISKLRVQIFIQKQNSLNIESLIEQVKEILVQLIKYQLESELNDLIEDNNRILQTIKEQMNKNNNVPLHQISEDISFTEVHRLMNEERKKLVIPEEVNDASLEKSISAFVELKVQTIEQRVILMDKRLKGMEDKYQTNLKSIWNVLSITESAIFDHLKSCKEKVCSKQKQNENTQLEKEKKTIFGFLKFGGK